MAATLTLPAEALPRVAVHAAPRWTALAERGAFAVLLAGVGASPLWLGSNRPWAWLGNALWAGACVLALALTDLAADRPFRAPRALVGSALAFVLAAVLAAAGLLPALDPHPLWDAAARAAPDAPFARTGSLNPALTRLALLRLLTDAGVFWLAYRLCDAPGRAAALLDAVALCAGACVLYGLVGLCLGHVSVLGVDKVTYLADATGTFLNRNAFATYAGLGLLAALARLSPAGRVGARCLAVGLLVLALGSGVVLSHSRAGLGAGLLACGVLLGLRAASRARSRAGLALSLVLVATLIASLAGLALAAGDGALRALGADAESRGAVYALVARAVGERPLAGHGFGAFEAGFPLLRDATVPIRGVWDKGHQVVLEAAYGLGLPGAALLALALALPALRCAMTFDPRRDLAAPRVAAAAAVLVGAHGLVDFGLQVQAVSLTFMALLGAGLARAYGRALSPVPRTTP